MLDEDIARRADALSAFRDAARAEIARRNGERARYDWRAAAFPEQVPPEGDWTYCLMMAGRGAGKTRAEVEWLRGIKDTHSPLAIIARTAADVRDVLVEGPAGILTMAPPWDRPTYEPSKRRITWNNGAVATTYSAEEPDSLRGPQHAAAICDELATWDRPEAWSNFEFGLRLGKQPKCVIATTPRPTPLIRDLVKRANDPADPAVVLRKWSTYKNRDNLAPAFFSQILTKYEGTRLGQQEIEAALLEDMEGALWTYALIDAARMPANSMPYNHYGRLANFARIVVAIDPAMTSGPESNETGIIVAGKDTKGHGYVLADKSGRYAPNEWAAVANELYKAYTVGGTVIKAAGNWSGGVLWGMASHQTFRNLTLSGTGQSGPHCLLGNGIVGVTLDMVNVIGCNRGISVGGTGNKALRWYGGSAINNASYGAFFQNVDDLPVWGVTFRGNAVDGTCNLDFDAGSSNIRVLGGYNESVAGTGCGVEFAGNVPNVPGALIQAVQFHNIGTGGAIWDKAGGTLTVTAVQAGNDNAVGPMVQFTNPVAFDFSGNVWWSGCAYKANAAPSGQFAVYEQTITNLYCSFRSVWWRRMRLFRALLRLLDAPRYTPGWRLTPGWVLRCLGAYAIAAFLGGLIFIVVAALLASIGWSCPAGSTCVTYRVFSGESVLVPSGDTTGATDVAAINAAIGQSKPNGTQSAVRLGIGTFYINPTQISVWPITTIEGHYLSAADGSSTGTPGGTILKAAGTWSSTVTTMGPAVMSLTDRNTLRNLTVVGLGGATPDGVRADDIQSDDFQNVDVVNCHAGWNATASNALANCGAPPYYPNQGCYSQLFHWFLGNVIGNSAFGLQIGGPTSFASDSFVTGTNFYNNPVHGTNNGCGDALGMTWNFSEYANSTGAAINNGCNMWSIVGNQIENARPPLNMDRVASYQKFPIVGNQVGNSTGLGPLMHITSNFGGSVSGNIYYSGCPYQVDTSIGSALAWYETPVPSGFGCNSGSTTNLDSIIIVPGAVFP